MNEAFSLKSVFDPVSQAVIRTEGDRITYANPVARSAFGEDISDKPLSEVFPPELLENNAESFVCSAKVCGRGAKIFVKRHEGFKLYYIDVISDISGPIFFTRRMLSYMRNCVTGIKIAADRCFSQLEDSIVPDEKLVSILYHYYYRLARTIIQLDSADKLERTEMAFAPEPVDLVSLCSELTSTMSNLNKEKEIKIAFSAESDRLTVRVDPSLIELMLLNLFSNSLKNVDSGNTIEFSIRQASNKIIITLNDNGRGIRQEKLSEIFSLPADSGDSARPDEGIGLGLYIAHEIVQLHNGALLLESREGEGVQIRILLSANEDTASVFKSPSTDYQVKSISPILTGLADILSSNCYGPKFED